VRLRSDVENSAIFVQDYMQLGPRLRINPGLRLGRWVGKLTPAAGAEITAVQDVGLDPRIGVVFDLDGKGGLVAKAHWGRYHQGMFAAFFDRVEGGDVFSDEQRHADPARRLPKPSDQRRRTLRAADQLEETGPENYKQPYVTRPSSASQDFRRPEGDRTHESAQQEHGGAGRSQHQTNGPTQRRACWTAFADPFGASRWC
jgi:hypothetical protein